MDLARGLAILLVVTFHSVLEVHIRVNLPSWLLLLNEIVSPMRLPVLVFLSGLLLAKSLQKSPVQYLAGKLSGILWPYLLWSLLMWLLFLAAEPYTHSGWNWTSAAEAILHPIDHLWFLRDLFVFYLLSLAAIRIPKIPLILITFMACIAADAAAMADISRAAYLFTFFTLGALASDGRAAWIPTRCGPRVVGVAAMMACCIVPAALMPGDVRYQPLLMPVVGAMGLLLVKVCYFAGSMPFLKGVRTIGRHSLTYYLVHWPVILVMTRVLPHTLFFGNPFVLLCITAVATLACGFIVSKITDRVPGFQYLVSLPILDRWRRA